MRKKRDVKSEAAEANELMVQGAVSLCPEDYKDLDSALILYGLELARKDFDKGNLLTDGKEQQEFLDSVSAEQAVYLNMRGAGLMPAEACQAMGINRAMPMLWEEQSAKSGIYNQCIKILKQMEADDLEAVVWKKALTDKNASIERMFALKSRKNEYKDNAPPVTNNVTQLRITVDGMNFDTSANFKDVQGDVNIAE